MQTELVVPLEENENYADSLTADYYGLDLHIDGETYSASFEDVDRAELALAILAEPVWLEAHDLDMVDAHVIYLQKEYQHLIDLYGVTLADVLDLKVRSYLVAMKRFKETQA